MTLHRRGLEIGPFNLFGLEINPTFHWYGLIIVLGIAAAAMLIAGLSLVACTGGGDPDPHAIARGLRHVRQACLVVLAAYRLHRASPG